MKKNYIQRLLLSLTITLCCITESSYSKSNDFSVSGSRITITNLTDEAKTEIEAAKGKENCLVIVNKTCTQDGLTAICQLGWIKKLEFEFGNKNIVDLSPLANLKKLKKLKIASAEASKTSPLMLVYVKLCQAYSLGM